MKSTSIIDKIYSDGLCLGCGLCESVCGRNSVKMELQSTGFFKPVVEEINPVGEKVIEQICPGINVNNASELDESEKIWGKIERLVSGYSLDADMRKRGSSGGIVSALASYVLEFNIVAAVLQVGGDSNDYERNSLKISKRREDVLECASSRYAPALIFDKINEILEKSDDDFCFIGKPCDISALNNFLRFYPQYKERFKLTIAIVCAGMPSFKGTETLVRSFNSSPPVTELTYRGNGWPGYFSFKDSLNQKFMKSYNESWGTVLNRHLNFRCKICPDGIGLEADIAVGDAWETTDGYPDFTEKDGQSLIIVRTSNGTKVVESAVTENQIAISPLSSEKLKVMQPYQYARRKRVGVRVLAFTIGQRRILNFTNQRMWSNLIGEKPAILMREFVGTFKRTLQRKV